MRKWRSFFWVGLLVVGSAFGLLRVKFDTDVLSILPMEMPEVRGLVAFQEMFSKNEELVLLLETDEEGAGTLGSRAAELGARLKEKGLAANVRWQPAWRQEPEALASLVAWLWMNGEPEEVEQLMAKLSEENAEATLQQSLEAVATALDGGQMVLSANDPFGLLGHSSMAAFFQASEHGGVGFESPDGKAHLVFVDAPMSLPSYREAGAWLNNLKAELLPWAEENDLRIGLTGDPAFQAEIGGAMEGDMSGTLGLTSAIIGAIFLLMQRRLSLLAGLGVTLGLVLVTAMGLAGWIYGELSIMAAGFAAILVGLAVDYGILICQEAKVADHDAAAIRKATVASIGWAAATTAAVFFALNLSGLPGIAQLGTIVAVGVSAGAVLMLVIYLPWVAKVGAGRASDEHAWAPLPTGGAALGVLILLLVSGASILASKGLPGVEFDRGLLRPKDSQAMEAFERIQASFPEWNSPALKLVVEGETEAEVSERLAATKAKLEGLMAKRPDLVLRADVPSGWWPSPARVEENRAALEKLAAAKDRLVAAADEAGFSEEGTGLGRAVLGQLPKVLALKPGVLPEGVAVAELLRGRVAKSGEGGRVLGTVEVAGHDALSAEDFQLLRDVSGEGVYLAGWALLKPAVLPLIKKDLTHVFLPMLGLMVVMLAMVFRRMKEVLLALGTMALSGLLLLAIMKLTGLTWNFLNIAATPLLLGTGLDYTIHILLAMRRTGGDFRAVWNGTGKAVVLCGVSTAIGFGSLAFASIDALSSLGRVAVLGIMISMLMATVVLPGISRLSGGRMARREDAVPVGAN